MVAPQPRYPIPFIFNKTRSFRGVATLALLLATGSTIACQAPNSPISSSSPASPSATAAIPAATSSTMASSTTAPSIQADSTRYENEALGIRFTTPTDFVWDETQLQSDHNVVAAIKTIELWQQKKFEEIQAGAYAHGTELPPNVRVAVYHNADRLALKDWVTSHSEQFVQPRDFQPRSIAGQTGLTFYSTGLYEHETVILPNPAGTEVITISLATVGVEEVDAPNQRAFAQVLSSLEWIGQ